MVLDLLDLQKLKNYIICETADHRRLPWKPRMQNSQGEPADLLGYSDEGPTKSIN